jgi:hypothetical protein
MLKNNSLGLPCFHFVADPVHFVDGPDQAFHFDADPDLASQNDADPSGSGSVTLL